MFLVVDIGNSTIELASYQEKVVESVRVNTKKNYTADEYLFLFSELLKKYHYEGAIISSVVPEITQEIVKCIEKYISDKVLIVGAGLKSGLNIKTDQPKEVGADLICDAVGSSGHFSKCLIVDFGTATKILQVEDKVLKGVVISPGMMVSLKSLVENASLLHNIDLKLPKKDFGTNTAESIQAGVVLGQYYMVEGFLQKYSSYEVIITGGYAEIFKSLFKNCKFEKNLLLDGLAIIYHKNKCLIK